MYNRKSKFIGGCHCPLKLFTPVQVPEPVDDFCTCLYDPKGTHCELIRNLLGEEESTVGEGVYSENESTSATIILSTTSAGSLKEEGGLEVQQDDADGEK